MMRDGQDWAHRMATLRRDVSLRATAGDLTGHDLMAHGNFKALVDELARDQRDAIARWGGDDRDFARRMEAEIKLFTELAKGFSAVALQADLKKKTIEAEAHALVGGGRVPAPSAGSRRHAAAAAGGDGRRSADIRSGERGCRGARGP